MVREIEYLNSWYFDSCALRYICNDKRFFTDLCPKSYKFVIVRREIDSKKVDLVHLPTNTRASITLKNVAYT